MPLQERSVINKVEILPSGDIQVRVANECYDDTITPVVAEPENDVQGVTDVKSSSYHRYVVLSKDVTPDDVQAFLDNTKSQK